MARVTGLRFLDDEESPLESRAVIQLLRRREARTPQQARALLNQQINRQVERFSPRGAGRAVHRQQRDRAVAAAQIASQLGIPIAAESEVPRAFSETARRIIGRGTGPRQREVAPALVEEDAARAGGPVDPSGIGATRALAQLESDFAAGRAARRAPITPTEGEQQFEEVQQFRRRAPVRELPTVRGVRRFGTAPRPPEAPRTTEDELLDRLMTGAGGAEIPSNVAAGLIARGTTRERLAAAERIRDANDQLRRDLAAAGNDIQLQREARLRWQAEVGALADLAGLTINAGRFAPGGFFGLGGGVSDETQALLDRLREIVEGSGGRRRAGAGGTEDLSQLSDEELRQIAEGR